MIIIFYGYVSLNVLRKPGEITAEQIVPAIHWCTATQQTKAHVDTISSPLMQAASL